MHPHRESLIETGQVDIRFCGDCQQAVHYCHTDGELAEAIRLNRCVAIERPAAAARGSNAPSVLPG